MWKKVGVSRWEESWRALWPLVLSRGRKLFNCQKHDNTVKNKLNEAHTLWSMSQCSGHSEMLYSWKTFHQKNYVLWWSLWMVTLGDMSKLCHRIREASVSSPYPTPSSLKGTLLLTCRRSSPEVASESKALLGTCCFPCLEFCSLILSPLQPVTIPFTRPSLTHPLVLKLNDTSSRKPSQNP